MLTAALYDTAYIYIGNIIIHYHAAVGRIHMNNMMANTQRHTLVFGIIAGYN